MPSPSAPSPSAGRGPASCARPRRLAAVALAAVLAAGCSGGAGTFLDARATAGPGTPTATRPPASGAAPPCPAGYAQPDPRRPRITLAFDLADDLATVRGTEKVTFTPDLPVRELVFRLTANTPPSVQEGNRVQVTAATADPAGAAFRVQPAGAAPETQGGLLVVPLAREVPAGRQVSATVGFTLTLGRQAFDRFGTLRSYAWWGSGQPLLAWERGVGWHSEPMLRFTAESATSEAAAVDLTVTAPAQYTVLSSGTQDPPATAGNGRRRWHAVADRARDVSVAVGPFTVAQRSVNGAKVVAGTPEGSPPAALLAEAERAVRELSRRFGPPPFPVINLVRLPVGGGGIEYPGSILMLDDSRLVTVHEVAHQWFYAMVGNSQARDPWLDEAFASWAEELVDGRATVDALRLPGQVGDSTTSYGNDERSYYATVYAKGAAALTAARQAAGAQRFDAAVRCYVNANAWRIARPADLQRALTGLPAAIAVLREAGAL
ncbi:MAG: M1 family aminopeptidase [Mycobacteriales bacterium]